MSNKGITQKKKDTETKAEKDDHSATPATKSGVSATSSEGSRQMSRSDSKAAAVSYAIEKEDDDEDEIVVTKKEDDNRKPQTTETKAKKQKVGDQFELESFSLLDSTKKVGEDGQIIQTTNCNISILKEEKDLSLNIKSKSP